MTLLLLVWVYLIIMVWGYGQAYGGLVEEYDFEMNNKIGGHNMFPQDYYIPAGTTDETLMYVPILISETNDENFVC